MVVLLRSGRELDERRVEKQNIEEENYAEIREEYKKHNSETTEEEKKNKDAVSATSGKRKSRKKGRG